jgi:hypothetical protein
MEHHQKLKVATKTRLFSRYHSRRVQQEQAILPLAQPYCQVITNDEEERSYAENPWNTRLLQLSNIASILCVVDCTVLPLLTILLSLLGLAEQPHHHMDWLHELGHQVAIYFVLPGKCLRNASRSAPSSMFSFCSHTLCLPRSLFGQPSFIVGTLTTFLNLVSHKKASLTIPALIGLALIYMANSSHSSHQHSSSSHEEKEEAATIFHWVLHTGETHRLTNIVGCALLLTSNYRAQRLGACKDKNCKHGSRK